MALLFGNRQQGYELQSMNDLPVNESQRESSRKEAAMADNGTPFSLVGKCIVEFVGLTIFVFVGTAQATGEGGVLNAALAHGLCIFILICALGHISGGHFNPAVTLGITFSGRMHPIHTVAYICSQLAGGVFGSMLARIALGRETFIKAGFGATMCGVGVQYYQGLLAEAFTTFMLVQTVLLTAVDTDRNLLAPLAIGLTVGTDIFAVGAISGGSMNPARSFGPNVIASIFHSQGLPDHFWTMHYIYYLGPIIGAAVAAVLYRAFYAREIRIVT